MKEGYTISLIAQQFGISHHCTHCRSKHSQDYGEQSLFAKDLKSTLLKLPSSFTQNIIAIEVEKPALRDEVYFGYP